MTHLSDYSPQAQAHLRWFETDHLPEHLRPVVEGYRTLALTLVASTSPSAQQTTALHQLVVSKDAAVRARILTVEAERDAADALTRETEALGLCDREGLA